MLLSGSRYGDSAVSGASEGEAHPAKGFVRADCTDWYGLSVWCASKRYAAGQRTEGNPVWSGGCCPVCLHHAVEQADFRHLRTG